MTPACRLRCCDASGCRSAGSEALHAALEAARDQLGGAAGAVEIKPVGCLRLCGRGPLVALDQQSSSGNWQQSGLYGGLNAGDAPALLQRAAGVGDELQAKGLDLAHPFFALQKPVVLEGCGLVDPESIDDAIAQGGYSQLQRVLAECTPEQVREQVRRSGLRG
ncbi:MAG: NADH-quinone oxidoreductase subunit L, partial [Prochlorococcaceae cyanobacterium]